MWYCKHINVSIEIGASIRLIFFHIALYMVHFVKYLVFKGISGHKMIALTIDYCNSYLNL